MDSKKRKVVPHCDTETGKIYGCKPGSQKWLHEQGHLVFDKSSAGSQLKLFKGYIFIIWMISMTCVFSFLSWFFKRLSIILLCAFLFLEFYEEIWCERYAKSKSKKRNK